VPPLAMGCLAATSMASSVALRAGD
jgi:hypothetical protein